MRRKSCNRLMLISLALTAFLFISGYGESKSSVNVKPNHFKKQNTTINTDEINTDMANSYHKIPSEVRSLTFIQPHQDEKIIKGLFLTPGKTDKVNVKKEAERLGLFQ
ncbi:type VII secretion EssA family protein [Sporolactobacillus laevolacticus]|uniref:type VII secretion EssA family protein n=1 Tax=Sporolactobacillus laevolacticus TaxID=33018 RepID=UPI0025B2BE8F|nr:type VII secretion EssA family protein [Sporolactobacillus laevolacticus]MDN3955289.1 DUF5383 family protein [Sporolactobacillus laevolacticus]